MIELKHAGNDALLASVVNAPVSYVVKHELRMKDASKKASEGWLKQYVVVLDNRVDAGSPSVALAPDDIQEFTATRDKGHQYIYLILYFGSS